MLRDAKEYYEDYRIAGLLAAMIKTPDTTIPSAPARFAKRGVKLLSLTFGLALLSLAAAAQATTYTYTDLKFPGAMGTVPTAIDSSGTVAGYYWDTGFFAHGFVYSGGTFTQVDAPGAVASGTFVTGINDAGVSVGFSSRRRAERSASL